MHIPVAGSERDEPTMDQLVISQVLLEASHKYPQQGIWYENQFTSYANLLERVLKLANSLQEMGIDQGTVVGILDANSQNFLELHYALAFVGAIMHPLNFRLSLNDLEYTIRQARDTWLFVGAEFLSLADTLKSLIPQQIAMPTQYDGLIRHGKPHFPRVTIHETDPFSIGFTTGTTGRPHGVLYRHRDLLLSSWQIVHHLALQDTPARLGPDETLLPLIPFFHIHGWGIPFIAPYIGASLVLSPKLSPRDQVELIAQHHVTWANMVPTQLYRLLEVLSGPLDDPLKVLTGGSALTYGLAKKASHFHVEISVIYGGTDQLASAISSIPPHSVLSSPEREKILSGRVMPLPMVEISLHDDQGQILDANGLNIGEIWIKSPWLPTEYVGDPQASKQAFRDGYFASGDLGILYPDGTLAIVDRLKDAIKSGGEWIAVNVLETILSEIDGIDQVAILTAPDPKWGERPVAVIQTRQAIDPDMILDYLAHQVNAGRIPKFWIPDHIFYIKDMPLTSAGKIHKQNLAAKLDMLPQDPHN